MHSLICNWQIKLIFDNFNINRSMEPQKTQTQIHTIQNLKNLITDILFTNTIYDCLPINSLVNSISYSMSIFDAVNILLLQKADQLLVWDQYNMEWIWMLTLVDTTRLIIHALKTFSKLGRVDFQSFQYRSELDPQLPVCKQDQILAVVRYLKQKPIHEILKQLKGEAQQKKKYIRMVYARRQHKLSYVTLTMLCEKIHRIVIQDTQDQKMIIAVLNFKDILLYLLRIADENGFNYYKKIQIKSLLETTKLKQCQISSKKLLWQAFQIMTDKQKSLWIVVVNDQSKKFQGMIYRQDFRDLLANWRLDYLWLTTGQFLKYKRQAHQSIVPQYRFFQLTDTTKDIIWKIVMSKRNSIICVDQNMQVISTIGLMELFRLYGQ